MTKSNEKRPRFFLKNVGDFLGKISPLRRNTINAAYSIQAYLAGQPDNVTTLAKQLTSHSSITTGNEQKSGERSEIPISGLSDTEILRLINYNLQVIDPGSQGFNPTLYQPVFVNELYKILAGTDPQTREIGEQFKRINIESKRDPSKEELRDERRRALLTRMRDYYEEHIFNANKQTTPDYSLADESTLAIQTPGEKTIKRDVPEDVSKFPTKVLGIIGDSTPPAVTQEKTVRAANEYARRITIAQEDTVKNPGTALFPLQDQTGDTSGIFGEVIAEPVDFLDSTDERASVGLPVSPDNYLNFLDFLLKHQFEYDTLEQTNSLLKSSHVWKTDPSVDCTCLTENDLRELRITPAFSPERLQTIDSVYATKLTEGKLIPDLQQVKEDALKKLTERIVGNFDAFLDRSLFYLVNSSMTEKSIQELLERLIGLAEIKHWTEASQTYRGIERNVSQVTLQIEQMSDDFGKYTLINYLFLPLKYAEQHEMSLRKRYNQADL